MSYPNAMKGEPCSQNTLRIQCVNQATGFPDRTSRRYHDAFAFTSNQDLKMAQTLPGIASRPDQTLALNMKLVSHHELQGFGGIGEGMGMQLSRDGRRILWRSEEHTSELQSRLHLVCRLLLEKKKNKDYLQYQYMYY